MTEKNYNPEQRQKKMHEKTGKTERKEKIIGLPIKEDKKEEIKEGQIKKTEIKEEKKEETSSSERQDVIRKHGQSKEKKEETKPEEKKAEKPKQKKIQAIVRGISLPISSKQSFAICKFIKNKGINAAIKELEEILLHRKALPMKGEIPHRKGKIMSGRYPENSIREFIKLLKNLNANADVNEISNPAISIAYANFASRPYGRFGRVRKKRTNVTIIAKEKMEKDKTKK